MKKYNVEISEAENYINAIWDGDCFQEPIEADSEEMAIELAKDWINDNGGDADRYLFRAKEI